MHNVFSGRGNESNSEDESLENASIVSNCSNTGNSVEDESDDNVVAIEKYEEKLLQALELATEKSAQTRTNALQTISETLSQKYMPDFVEDRKITITDIVEKAIRRGKGAEQSLGAQVVPMLILHLGDGDEVVKVMAPLLLQTMQNKSISYEVRAKCCSALALAKFLGSNDIGDLVQLMQQLEAIFSGSYLKGDKTPSAAGSDASQLHSAALSAWGLLMTLVPSGDFVSLFNLGSSVP